ncbi:MAG: DegT/DnrJ/EryC1/StrS family aminotransferase [Oscillospiraceae bacterium]|jgi:dTDP-4-amino-4,6-dideoxygalactose transaminase|nr:DegT/DnrJ/EryC1/StrS family aminotransferase [Oscillospiraceae bacterium]
MKKFRDLNKQYDVLKNEIDKAISEVLEVGYFILGKEVAEIEEQLSEYVGVKHCVTCASGTDALVLALKTLDVGQGDAVFVPDFTYIASASSASWIGVTPVFVDIERNTFNINPEKLEKTIQNTLSENKLTPKAIIAVDMFGRPADYIKIRAIADKYGLFLIEDGAQGFGGKIGNRKACSFGDISTTSFFPAKPLGCYGDGGALFTDNDEYYEKLILLRKNGSSPTDKYDNLIIGTNSRLDTIQAAILKVKLKAFADYEVENINKIADLYSVHLKDVVQIPIIQENFYSSWAQYSVLLPENVNRQELQKKLKDEDIPTMIYFPKPLHSQKAFANLNYSDDEFAETIDVCKRILSLPIHPYMPESEVETIAEAVKRYV